MLTVATDGTIGYVSPAIRRCWGSTRSSCSVAKLVAFLHPDDADDVITRLARGHGHHDVGARLLMRHEPDGWREVLLFVHAGPALDAVGYRSSCFATPRIVATPSTPCASAWPSRIC